MNSKISYLKIILYVAGGVATSFAVFTLASCSGKNGKSCDDTEESPAGIYRECLSETRKLNALSFGDLTAHLKRWQMLRDSVYAQLRQDTTRHPHDNPRQECLLLHDSIRTEFSRLARSELRTYKEVLALKAQFSPYVGDTELLRSAEEIRPFFASLDNRPAYRGDKEQILSMYRTLLAETLRRGIHSHNDLTGFIEKEDAVFRAFLACLCDWGETNTADITRDTEKCCAEIFHAAARQEITYKEATIYMAMRTGRRVIQNVRACLDDIHRGEVTTPRQAHAYIWMVLQPYASLDGLCMVLLSPRDKEELDRIATETPGAFAALHKVLESDSDRLDELPAMFMEIFIASL